MYAPHNIALFKRDINHLRRESHRVRMYLATRAITENARRNRVNSSPYGGDIRLKLLVDYACKVQAIGTDRARLNKTQHRIKQNVYKLGWLRVVGHRRPNICAILGAAVPY